MDKRPIIETETMVLDLKHSINGYTKIHRTLHYVDGNCERVVVAFTEEELKLANKAPEMLEALIEAKHDIMNYISNTFKATEEKKAFEALNNDKTYQKIISLIKQATK